MQQLTTKEYFNKKGVQDKFNELLGKKSGAFVTSVLQIVMNNDLLKQADPETVYNAAAMAATLDLPINQNLGFAYIIPYNVKQSDGTFKKAAQFQIGYKGFIQLAMRSGQFAKISSAAVYDGQIVSSNPLEGYVFDWNVKSDKVIGYAAFFELINGFQKTLYMSVDEIKAHGNKYSKTYGKQYGLWNTDFNAMATKTVLKLLLSKYAPLSVEMQNAVLTDQSVINNAETLDVTYVDNEPDAPVDKEAERLRLLIEDAPNKTTLSKFKKEASEKGLGDLFNNKLNELENARV